MDGHAQHAIVHLGLATAMLVLAFAPGASALGPGDPLRDIHVGPPECSADLDRGAECFLEGSLGEAGDQEECRGLETDTPTPAGTAGAEIRVCNDRDDVLKRHRYVGKVTLVR